MIQKLIDQLDRVATDDRLPVAVRTAAKRDADGYRKALVTKQA